MRRTYLAAIEPERCIMADNELNEQASANWLLIPERGVENGVIYGGSNRLFESVRNAIRFVMEDLPAQQRSSAEIRTEADRVYKFAEIAKLYSSPNFTK
jgi:hypothetical protein